MKIKNIYGVDTSKIVNKIRNKKFKIFRISQDEDLTKNLNGNLKSYSPIKFYIILMIKVLIFF